VRRKERAPRTRREEGGGSEAGMSEMKTNTVLVLRGQAGGRNVRVSTSWWCCTPESLSSSPQLH